MLDLRDGTPKYIYARVNAYWSDVQNSTTGLNTDLLDYYAAIPNYAENRLTVNPSQE